MSGIRRRDFVILLGAAWLRRGLLQRARSSRSGCGALVSSCTSPRAMLKGRPALGHWLVYILINPNNAGVAQDLPSIVGAAGPLGINLEVVKASTEDEIDAAFSIVARQRAQALMVMNDAFLQLVKPN